MRTLRTFALLQREYVPTNESRGASIPALQRTATAAAEGQSRSATVRSEVL